MILRKIDMECRLKKLYLLQKSVTHHRNISPYTLGISEIKQQRLLKKYAKKNNCYISKQALQEQGQYCSICKQFTPLINFAFLHLDKQICRSCYTEQKIERKTKQKKKDKVRNIKKKIKCLEKELREM